MIYNDETITTSKNQNGNTIEKEYDEENNLIRETIYRMDNDTIAYDIYYDVKTKQKIFKMTYYPNSGQERFEIEYSSKTGKETKRTKYSRNGNVMIEYYYDEKTGQRIKAEED